MCSVYVIQLFDETAYASVATAAAVAAYVLHLFTCYKCVFIVQFLCCSICFL